MRHIDRCILPGRLERGLQSVRPPVVCGRLCPRRSRSGQVLVIAIIAMTLLVGLIFYVYNTGDQVNRRLELQNTADSVVISGAGWMARSMNVVAMNNVAQARMLAMIAVLDSLPLAAEITVAEMSAEQEAEDNLTKGVANQLSRGIPDTRIEQGYDQTARNWTNFLLNGMRGLYNKMSSDEQNPSQYDALVALDRAFDTDDERERENGYLMKRATHWRVDGGDVPFGAFWQAAQALGYFSEATVNSAGVLAQTDAVQFGRANMADEADKAFLVPVVPSMPVKQGDFQDFEAVLTDHMVITGDGVRKDSADLVARLAGASDISEEVEHIHLSGGAIPDWAGPHRLGPWARLYRWRYDLYQRWGGTSYGAADNEIGRGHEGGQSERIGYSTYGPVRWALDRIISGFGLAGWREGLVDVSRFAFHLERITNVKLGYMFGLSSPQRIQYANRWITNYREAVQFAADPDNRENILRTRYYRPVVMSSVSWDDPDWLKDSGTYYSDRGEVSPFDDPKTGLWVWEPDGWYDVSVRRSDCEKLNDYVWRRKRQYKVTYEPRVNLPLRTDPATDQPIPWDVYYVSWYVFGGIEVRDEVEISNPCNWRSGETEDRPKPILLDTDKGDYDPKHPSPDNPYRRDWFTYLGVARGGSTSAVWSQRFATANPMRAMAAMAQAKVFNTSSWDLWTQDWQVQLMPITGWSDWIVRLDQGQDNPDRPTGIVPVELLVDISEYMRALDGDLPGMFINH